MYPQLEPVINYLSGSTNDGHLYPEHWGVPPSTGRQFIVDCLRVAAQEPHFAATMAASLQKLYHDENYSRSIQPWFDPWIVPTEADVNELIGLGLLLEVEPLEDSHTTDARKYFERQKYRISAASVAIQFLQSLSRTACQEVRSIILHEDRVAISWPESHAQGLIAFCQDNPQLRIERRVSLWKNALPGGSVPLFKVVHGWTRGNTNPALVHTLRSESISRDSIARWIMEALRLPELGMPPNAFSLLLECDGLPNRSRQIFDIVKQDAAWQTALERWIAGRTSGLVPWQWMYVRGSGAYIAQGFPDAVRSLIDGDSLVKCDFELDNACDLDTEKLVAESQHWRLDDWHENWCDLRHAIALDTEPPLPSWLDIRREDLLPSEDEASSH